MLNIQESKNDLEFTGAILQISVGFSSLNNSKNCDLFYFFL